MKEYRRYKQATDVFFYIIFKMQIHFLYHYIDASVEKKTCLRLLFAPSRSLHS